MTGPARVQKAVIPAAGRGTRVRDVRGDLPKECVEVAGLPMIAHALLEMSLSGLEQVAVVVSGEKPELIDRLRSLPPFPPRRYVERLYPGAGTVHARDAWPEIVLTEQTEPRGVIDALSTARGYIDGDDFVLVMPDNLLVGARPVTALLAEAYAAGPGAFIAFRPVAREEAERLGNCGRVEIGGEGPVYAVRRLHPKRRGVFAMPAGLEAINRAVGRSIMPAAFAEPESPGWDPQPGTREIDDAPRFGQLAREGRLRAVATDAELHDLGQPAGIHAARMALGG